MSTEPRTLADQPIPEAGRTPQTALAAGQLPVVAILGLFLLVGLWFSMVVPPFETPDELYHYALSRHLAQGNPLPIQSAANPGPWRQEGSQAPLYYLLTGALTAGIDQSDLGSMVTPNRHANIGDPLYPGNKNRMLYSSAQPPLHGANQALHVGRWLSLLLGALTLWLVYRTAKLTFPTSRLLPLISLLFVAAIPQFVFISASFSNDSMIIAASTLVVYWLARLLAKPASEEVRIWEWLVLGLLLGIAALSKLQGLGLFALAAFAVLIMAWLRQDWRLPLRALLPVALPALAVAGWWYWRNYTLYGDWLGVSNLIAINGRRQDSLTLSGFWHEFRGLRYSFWGLFGWFSILLPVWIYTILDIVLVVSGVGLILNLASDRAQLLAPKSASHRVRLLLLAWAALSLTLLAYWISRADGSQGRLLLPGIVALAVLAVLGLSFLLQRLPRSLQMGTWAGITGLLAGASLYAVAWLLPSAYAAPAPLADLPASATPIHISYDDGERLDLLAVGLPDGRFAPGQRVPVMLYWRAPQPLDEDYRLFVQLLDETGAEIGNVTSHPGWGRNPTSLWQPGAIYPDWYEVLISQPLDEWSPLLARVYVGFIDPDAAENETRTLTARTVDGDEITPLVGGVVIAPQEPVSFDSDTFERNGAQFGDLIELRGTALEIAEGGDTMKIALLWEAVGAPTADYTAFVHLLDAAGNQVAGFDQAPARNRFPTRYWQTGDRILSEFEMPLSETAPGRYQVWTGLYAAESQGQPRLPVTTPPSKQVSDQDSVLIGEIEIGP